MKKSGKVQEKSVKVREKMKFFSSNDLEKVDVTYFVSIFCPMIRVISVTFCYTADKLESGKNILSQGKVRENENLYGHPDKFLYFSVFLSKINKTNSLITMKKGLSMNI